MNRTEGDVYCDVLADEANLCAQAHDANWWQFTTCMFAIHQDLASTKTFETAAVGCARSHLSTYSLQALKSCYTGAEGASLAYNSARKSEKQFAGGSPHPVWVYVGASLVNPADYENLDLWGVAVKKELCKQYKGPVPKSCRQTLFTDVLL